MNKNSEEQKVVLKVIILFLILEISGVMIVESLLSFIDFPEYKEYSLELIFHAIYILTAALVLYLITKKNLSELKKQNEQLLLKNNLFFKTFKKAPIPIAILELGTYKFIYVNKALCDLLEYDEQDFIGKTSKEMNLYLKSEQRDEIINNFEKRPFLISYELDFLTKTGKTINLSLSSDFIEIKNVKYAITTAKDISSYREYEKTLADSETKFHNIFSNINIGFVLSDCEGLLIDVNESFCELIGFKSNQLIGKNYCNYLHPYDVDESRRNFNLLADGTKNSFQMEKRYVDINGNSIWCRVNTSLLYDSVKPKGEISYISLVENISEQKKIEIILNSIIEAAPYPIITLDKKGFITKWNKASENVFGYKSEEVLGKFNPIYPNTGGQDYIQLTKRILQGDSFENLEVIRMKKNGEFLKVILSAIPLRDSTGEIFGAMGIYLDAMETKKLSSGLEYAYDSLMEISDRYEDILYSLDSGGKIIWISNNISTIFPEISNNTNSLKGLKIFDLFPGLPKEFKGSVEITHNIKGIDYTFTFFEKRTATGISGIIKDISTFKKIEGSLAETQFQLSFLFKHLPKIVFFEVNKEKISISENIRNLIGYSKEELEKDQDFLKKLVHPEDYLVNKDFAEQWYEGKSSRTMTLEFKCKRADNMLIWLEEIMLMTYDRKGNKIITGLLIDITERKNTEIRLLDAKDKAEEGSRFKSAFLSNINNDLRSPIAGILGMAEILLDELEASELKERVKQIQTSGQGLLNSINSIINLSLLETSRINFSIEDVYINDIIEELQTKYFSETNTVIKIQLDKNLIAVADRKLLRNVIENIVDNSLKYNPTSEIKIAATNVKINNEEYCQINIIDFKTVIPAENIDFIFDEFKQFPSDFNYQGSGIALSVAKKMTELMKGIIEFESSKDNGTIFKLFFPMEMNKISSPTNIKTEKKEDIIAVLDPKKTLPRVLLVEDNNTNKVITVLFLKSICNIEHSPNGETALQMIKDNYYDLILMDINLGPGMNGIETSNRIRKNDYYRNIPIIAVTGYAMPGDEDKLLHLGFNQYIAKPFTKESIISVVNKVLQKYSVVN